MAPACFVAAGRGRPQRVAAPVPVAWLEGDVLAEYLRFLDEAAAPAAPPPPPVAWLEGEVRDEFLRFLEESRAAAAAAAAAGPDRQEEEEEHGRGGDESDDDGGLVVDDDHRSSVDGGGFMDDDSGDDDVVAMEDESEDGGAVTGRDDQDAEAVLEMLLPHILDLPAFRARAAAAAEPAQQEPAPGFPCDEGGWMQRGGVCLIDANSCGSCYSSDEEMSSREEEIEEGASVFQECYGR